jgi:pilus assembly protein CpaC
VDRKRQHASWNALRAAPVALCILTTPSLPQDSLPRTAIASHQAYLALVVDRAKLIHLPFAANTVFVANPDIADVHVQDPTTVLVYGKKTGTTTVFGLGVHGEVVSYAVHVEYPTADIDGALAGHTPDARVRIASTPSGMIVSGTVASPAEAQTIRATAQQYLGEKEKLGFDVNVAQSTQVNLQIRVVEVTRQAEVNFGFNWGAISNNGSIAFGLLTGRAPLNAVVNSVSGTSTTSFGDFARNPSTPVLSSLGFGYRSPGGSVDMSTLLDALQTEGLVTVLAQPNLTAISGATSNFLAGGEFPVPVSQGLNQISIEWKNFGVSVDFTPTVLDANRISIKVRPEVSELSQVGSVVLNNITIPGITVRRAETTVELASGQSFAIAGLYQNNLSNTVNDFPGLGDVPVIGPLLRSSSFQRNESELVIIVTPFIVRPVAQASDLHTPEEKLTLSNDLDRILRGRVTAKPGEAGTQEGSADIPHLTGDAGFMLEQ